MRSGAFLWPLRLAGAAIFFSGCSAVSPHHVGHTAHPAAVSKSGIAGFSGIERKGLKVLLRRGEAGLKLSCPGGIRLLDPDNGSTLAEFGPGSRARLAAEHGKLIAGAKRLQVSEAQIAPLEKNGIINVGKFHYRGQLFIKAAADSLLLVNEVSLDEYLYGVLPSEVGPSWPPEALKAQAVAARTYAIFRAGASKSRFFDLDDSTRSQVYFGTSKEDARTNQAVDASSGQVLTWQGKAIEAFFHSNCGGHTADAAHVWGGALPYLKGVEDSFCDEGPHFAWHSEIDHDQLISQLSKAGIQIRDFESIEPKTRDDSGRILQLKLQGEGADLSVGAQAFRIAMGPNVLRSTKFSANRRGDTHRFEGRGWGHGVGLCQEGALGMAKSGYRYKDILSHYFSGTKVKTLVD